jgi:hypothetical protein
VLGSSSTLPPAPPSPLPLTSPCRQRALVPGWDAFHHKDPFGRLRTAAAPFRAATASYLFETARDPTSSALHPRLSLRATRFVSRCGFHRHRLPRQTLLFGFCSSARPADTSRGSQVPSLPLRGDRATHIRGCAPVESPRPRSRAVARSRAPSESLPGHSSSLPRSPTWWGAPRLRVTKAQTPLLSTPREGRT